MDAITNFSLKFAKRSESKAGTPDWALTGHITRRIATRISLLCLAIGFSILGTLIILNRCQADLNDLPGGKCFAVVGGVSAILVGKVFLIAAFLHWRFRAKRSDALSFSREIGGLTSQDPSPKNRCVISTSLGVERGNYA